MSKILSFIEKNEILYIAQYDRNGCSIHVKPSGVYSDSVYTTYEFLTEEDIQAINDKNIPLVIFNDNAPNSGLMVRDIAEAGPWSGMSHVPVDLALNMMHFEGHQVTNYEPMNMHPLMFTGSLKQKMLDYGAFPQELQKIAEDYIGFDDRSSDAFAAFEVLGKEDTFKLQEVLLSQLQEKKKVLDSFPEKTFQLPIEEYTKYLEALHETRASNNVVCWVRTEILLDDANVFSEVEARERVIKRVNDYVGGLISQFTAKGYDKDEGMTHIQAEIKELRRLNKMVSMLKPSNPENRNDQTLD